VAGPRASSIAAVLALLVLGLALGCKSTPIFKYSLDVPAQTLLLPGAPPVRDGRARFREIFCSVLALQPAASAQTCGALLHRLSDEPEPARLARPLPAHEVKLTVLFVPGLLGDCAYGLAPPFEPAVKRLRQLGYDARLSQVNASANSHSNAERLAREIEQLPPGQLVLVGHARGAVDILELLVSHPTAASRVQAVLSVAGAINGSPLASSPRGEALLFERGDDTPCTLGEREALPDLEPAHRLRWLLEHPLPPEPLYFSLVAFRPVAEMSPPLSRRAAALAAIDPRNDGLLPFFDQVIPGSELLGYVNADHFSIAAEPAGTVSLSAGAQGSVPQDVVIEAGLLRISEALASRRGQ
jgi:pimeloyl-ACP methyl ester carboxylesterase